MNVKRALRKILFATVCIALAGLLFSWLLYLAGGRLNTSPSIPLGLYWTTKVPLTQGTFVLVCPPDTPPFQEARRRSYIDIGTCPGNYGRLMKQIAGRGGDLVVVDGQGVAVNGKAIPNSTPMAMDPDGRPMPSFGRGSYTLAPHQFLLMGSNPLSFDARYFGPVGEEAIVSTIKPVITW